MGLEGYFVVFSQAEIKFWREQGMIVDKEDGMYWNGAKVIENRYLGTGEKV